MSHDPKSPLASSVQSPAENREASGGVGSGGSSAGLTLKLVLTHHWYDETVSGRKRVEYRSMTEADGKPSRWYSQIWTKRHEIKRVRFSRGYTPTMQVFDVVKIDIGPCHIPGWNGDFYRIHFSSPNGQISQRGQ